MKIQAQVGAVVLMMAVTATPGNVSNLTKEHCIAVLSPSEEEVNQLQYLYDSTVAERHQAIASGEYAKAERLRIVLLKAEADRAELRDFAAACTTLAKEEYDRVAGKSYPNQQDPRLQE